LEPWAQSPEQGFTATDLLAILFVVVVLLLTLWPALGRNSVNVNGYQCLSNHRQLANAWRQWSADNNDNLLSAIGAVFNPNVRPVWISGSIDYNAGNPSNYDPRQDIMKSPMWSYLSNTTVFRCPADPTTASDQFVSRLPRVRSYSMSHVFGRGEWLSGTSSPQLWRIYGKGAEIVIPAKTFLFTDEHPGTINDGSFSNTCTGNQPNDDPGSSKLVAVPGNYHNGGCTFSFADGHVETHKWQSDYLRLLTTADNYVAPQNISAVLYPNLYLDCHWLAERTTAVK